MSHWLTAYSSPTQTHHICGVIFSCNILWEYLWDYFVGIFCGNILWEYLRKYFVRIFWMGIFMRCNMWKCRRHICGIRGFEAKWRWLWTLSLQFAFMSPNQPPFSRSKNLAFRNLLTLTDFRKSSRQGKGDIVRIVIMWYYARSILDFWSNRICYFHSCSA